jgi:hypothetical protein
MICSSLRIMPVGSIEHIKHEVETEITTGRRDRKAARPSSVSYVDGAAERAMPVAQFTVRRSPGIQVSIACRQVAGTIRKGSRQSSPVF